MPLAIRCSSCDAQLNVPDTAAGKRVKCPKCAAVVSVPAVEEAEEGGFDVVEPPAKSKPKATHRASREDDEDERPVRSKRRPVEDDEDDRPKSRRQRDDDDEDQEEDERPRKKKSASVKSKKRKGGPPLGVLIGGGIAALLVLISLLYLVGVRFTGPGGLVGPSAPAGYTAVNDTEGGFQVFLPGQMARAKVDLGEPNRGRDVAMSVFSNLDRELEFRTRTEALKPPSDYKLGDKMEDFLRSMPGLNAQFYTIDAKEMIQLDGRPALLLKLKHNRGLFGPGGRGGRGGFDDEPDRTEPNFPDPPLPPGLDPKLAEAIKKEQEESNKFAEKSRKEWKERGEREAKKVRHEVFIITTNMTRLIKIKIESDTQYPDEQMLKTIRESFRFR